MPFNLEELREMGNAYTCRNLFGIELDSVPGAGFHITGYELDFDVKEGYMGWFNMNVVSELTAKVEEAQCNLTLTIYSRKGDPVLTKERWVKCAISEIAGDWMVEKHDMIQQARVNVYKV
jgi:hypothetical protein